MSDKYGRAKVGTIVALLALIAILHYGALTAHSEVHILHRELFFVPILLASFWFGLRFGVGTSVTVSLIYAPYILFSPDLHGASVAVGSQIFVFNLTACILGWLSDQERRRQQEVLAAENLAVLGRAAAAVGQEMAELVAALKRSVREEGGRQRTQVDRDFHEELRQLERSVELLSSFAAPGRVPAFSRDLNEIVRDRILHHQDAARRAGATLLEALDERGCPVQVNPERIAWVLDNVLKNAIEVTKPGQTVSVRTQRTGVECRIEVEDQGPGIRPEHLPKIFTPFFTTKEKGSGLALAGCKKIMRDLGGDILVTSTWGEGATFVLTIPREKGVQPLS